MRSSGDNYRVPSDRLPMRNIPLHPGRNCPRQAFGKQQECREKHDNLAHWKHHCISGHWIMRIDEKTLTCRKQCAELVFNRKHQALRHRPEKQKPGQTKHLKLDRAAVFPVSHGSQFVEHDYPQKGQKKNAIIGPMIGDA